MLAGLLLDPQAHGVALAHRVDGLVLHRHGLHRLREVAGVPLDVDRVADLKLALEDLDRSHSDLPEVVGHDTDLLLGHGLHPLRGW